MNLDALDNEISLLIEQAKTSLGSSYNMEILEEVSLADFSRLSISAESLINSVRDIMFANSRKYIRTDELSSYKEFFNENKLDSNIRVMTYPSIMKNTQFKLNSPALLNYVKEAIVRYSERGEEIDVDNIRMRSMSHMFKSLTGLSAKSDFMSRAMFAEQFEKIVKGEGRIFVKVHPLKLIRLASTLPSVISYIDTNLLAHQVKTFSYFAKDYTKKMEQISANYPDDFNLSKEVTKYKQILENAVYDMVFIYRTIRNTMIDLNDEYYRVLKFLKNTYGRSTAMTENAKILASFDMLTEAVEEYERLKAQHAIGLLSESAIGDALANFKNKISAFTKKIGDDIDRVKKRNSDYRMRTKQYKALMSKIKRGKLVPKESMTMYVGTFDSIRVRYPSDLFMAMNNGYYSRMLSVLNDPANYRRELGKSFNDSESNTKRLEDVKNETLHTTLLSYCDYVALKSEKMTIELAEKYLKSFYLGDRITAVPDMRRVYGNMVNYIRVFKLLDVVAYYKVYDLMKEVSVAIDNAITSGSATSTELNTFINHTKAIVEFELRVMELHHDCVVKLADETYTILKRVAEENDSELVLPKLIKESAGFMLESEEFIPVSDMTKMDLEVDPSEVPVGVSLVSGEETTVAGEFEVSEEELAEIPEPDTVDPSENGSVGEEVVQMIESAFAMSINGAAVSPSLLTESVGSVDRYSEYMPIFESVELVLEAAQDEKSSETFIAKLKRAVASILENIKKTNTWQKLKALGTTVKGMFASIRAKIKLAEDNGKKEDATKLKMALGKLASVVTALETVGKKIGAAPDKLREMVNNLLFEMDYRKASKGINPADL